MIHQLFLSGHVKKEARQAPSEDGAQMMCDLMAMYNVTGLTLFADGTFVSALEGKKQDTLHVFSAIRDHESLSQTDIIMELNPDKCEFTDYKIGVFSYDFSATVPQSFRLTSENILKVLPKNISADLRVLFKTFARINNLDIRRPSAA